MKIHEECRPCLLRQMEMTARAAGADEDLVNEVAGMARCRLADMWDPECSPPEISAPLYHATARMCGTNDPYLAKKVHYTREALKYLAEFESRMSKAQDPFDLAARISIAGNVIDFGTGQEKKDLEVANLMDGLLEKTLHIDDMQTLRRIASGAEKILFIGDNAGETVFDRPLLSILSRSGKVYYGVRAGPIINDVTKTDALLAGIGLHAQIVSSGSAVPGILLQECSSEFQDLYREADLIIAKGQGNFETLTEQPKDGRLFMLFIIKCPVAARQVEGEVGDMVVMRW